MSIRRYLLEYTRLCIEKLDIDDLQPVFATLLIPLRHEIQQRRDKYCMYNPSSIGIKIYD